MTLGNLDLTIPMKKMAKKIWPELENLELDQYDVKNFEVHCIRCNGIASTTAYRIESEGEWKGYKKEVICSDCGAREELMNQNGSFRRTFNARLTDEYMHVPKGLEDASFKNYNASNAATKNALYACVQYVKGFDYNNLSNNHNLLIMGNPGTGKSHLSLSIAKYLRSKEIGSVGFITTGKLLAIVKDTYQKGASRTENDIFKDIESLDFLVLDDLGAEVGSASEFSWSRTKIFEIVNSRIGKPTVYTTNFNDKNIAEAVGERVSSRLQTNTKFVNLFTEDYRKNLLVL